MLAARIVSRVLSRMASFGFKGALVMTLAGVVEICLLQGPWEWLPTSVAPDANAFVVPLLSFFAFTGFVVFATVGALTSRSNDVYALFTKMYRIAIIGSFVGAIIGAICFSSLFAMLTWITNGKFDFLPAHSPMLALEMLQANAAVGYCLGVFLGFLVGTSLGAWRGAATFQKNESSTR